MFPINDNLLEVKELKKYFPIREGFFSKPVAWVKAVDKVSFQIKKGETLGIVGESGCGKTTLINTILRLEEPTEGEVIFNGQNIFELDKDSLRKIRKNIQVVFQDPFWSLNPRFLIKDIIGEPIRVHENVGEEEFIEKVQNLLQLVGLPANSVYKYPHEFSGGQRQRIAIARALALHPKLVILDEPTSSIDLVSQASVLKLLEELKKELSLTYILISHDLSVVHNMADKIIVMYLGKIVEYGEAHEVFRNPQHPYTQALFAAIPDIYTEGMEGMKILEGNVPSPINPPKGCYFHTRCPHAMEICKEIEPLPVVETEKQHMVTCHLIQKKANL
ncbi:ABC transporter ATP-binding protein [Natronincola ferrireducens]|uniref:Oligopeptide transport system ATP-binding protein n=1 Tax=Natronincola ferrireducens TaxID=393762 RepID=A0A1G9F5J1_9FIRM|nr:ABC transporter ATP-binding protein [Natronincola ferrireducens]SDK83654.1 oligopeptide transport system ATP-binding protein [Natronincola ferrireducens]